MVRIMVIQGLGLSMPDLHRFIYMFHGDTIQKAEYNGYFVAIFSTSVAVCARVCEMLCVASASMSSISHVCRTRERG